MANQIRTPVDGFASGSADSFQVTTEKLPEKQTEWERILQQAYQAGVMAGETMGTLESCFKAIRLVLWEKERALWMEEWENAYEQARSHLEKLSKIAAVYDTAERSNQNVFKEH